MKATKAIIQVRVEEVLTIRLAGAQLWDVREYVREKEAVEGSPWQLAEGQKPLSDSQLYRYMDKADQLLASSVLASRKKLLRRHEGRREYLLGVAVNQGDVRAAASILKDLAELQGLYPAKGIQVSGKKGSPLVLHIVEEIVGKTNEIGAIVEEVVTHESTSSTNTNPPPPGTAGLPPI